MSIDNNSTDLGRFDSPSESGSSESDWSDVFRREVFSSPSFSRRESLVRDNFTRSAQSSFANSGESQTLEITPVLSSHSPVMYAQAGDLPDLPPPVRTDAAPNAPRPQNISMPEYQDAVDRLRTAQQPDSALPSHVQMFLSRELGLAALADSFVDRPRVQGNNDPPCRPGFCDAAITALEGTLTQLRRSSGTGWQIEAAITQGLLGYAQLHRSGIGERLNADTVQASLNAGGDRARFATSGLTNVREARQNLERLLNPPQGTPALPEPVRAEIRRVLSALPAVREHNGQLRMTGSADADPLMQIGLTHGRTIMAGFGAPVR